VKIYSAHIADRAAPELVREGFAWGGAFFGPFWLLGRRAWVPAAVSALLTATVTLLPEPAQTVLALAAAWAHGLFGHDLVRWSLARRGFREEHVVAADTEETAFARLMAARPDLVEGALA
jgi:hypothetical protein